MLTNAYSIFNISWDTDGEDIDLPTNIIMKAENEDAIADMLSDKFGFCVNSFSCEKL